NYDRGGGPGDLLFGWQLTSIGCEPWICQHARAYVLSPRSILPNLMSTRHAQDEVVGADGHWSYKDGERYWMDRMGEQTHVSRNPYDMHTKRAELWPWRELSQQREAVIPYIESTDVEYFRL